MTAQLPEETALIIVCTPAEEAVGRHRRRLDRAASFGVPAHVTITYPFRPHAQLSGADRAVLQQVFAGRAAFTMELRRTAWFDESVLYLALEDPRPVVALTDAVTDRFPEHPPYAGAYDAVTPHLTVGHDAPHEVLLEAEGDVTRRLPVTVAVDRVELWTGPALAGPVREDWRRIDSFPLGGDGQDAPRGEG